jgi:hypothetical protein
VVASESQASLCNMMADMLAAMGEGEAELDANDENRPPGPSTTMGNGKRAADSILGSSDAAPARAAGRATRSAKRRKL